MLPSCQAFEIREYLEPTGHNPFRAWFDSLNSEAASKVTVALYRLGLGNLSNVKTVASGVFECKVHFGPGYRVYFGRHGDRLVIILGAGSKKTQQNDIRLAIRRWEDYKRRKNQRKESK